MTPQEFGQWAKRLDMAAQILREHDKNEELAQKYTDKAKSLREVLNGKST